VAFVDGKEWTARSTEDAVTMEAGSLVEVTAIEGVKIIVKPYKAVGETVATAEK
jgi:membrane protein implicated in regulation of membrane protease activity